jgi:hypothetical protein
MEERTASWRFLRRFSLRQRATNTAAVSSTRTGGVARHCGWILGGFFGRGRGAGAIDFLQNPDLFEFDRQLSAGFANFEQFVVLSLLVVQALLRNEPTLLRSSFLSSLCERSGGAGVGAIMSGSAGTCRGRLERQHPGALRLFDRPSAVCAENKRF